MMRGNKSLLKSISNSNLKRPQGKLGLKRQWFFFKLTCPPRLRLTKHFQRMNIILKKDYVKTQNMCFK